LCAITLGTRTKQAVQIHRRKRSPDSGSRARIYLRSGSDRLCFWKIQERRYQYEIHPTFEATEMSEQDELVSAIGVDYVQTDPQQQGNGSHADEAPGRSC